ncbi:MAG: hypothetical protein R2774_11005 [Saprospiraceae bacterium]
MRIIFGIFTSLVTAGLILLTAQMLREGLFPKPFFIPESQVPLMNEWIATWKTNVYFLIGVSHGLAAFSAGLISSLVTVQSRMTAGVVAVCIVFIPVMVYLFTYTFPVLFVVADTVATAILGFLGISIGSTRYSGY